MKKFLMLLIAACLMAPIYADSAKDLRKAKEKEKKEKMKEYKKEGWKLFGSSRTLDVKLLEHYQKLEELGADGHEIVGIATNVKSKSTAHQRAITDAATSYAQAAGRTLKGRILQDIADNESLDDDAAFNHFYAAFESQVEKEIQGEMEESYSVIHDNGNGTYDLQTFFIVSEGQASRARMRALENAMKESEVAQKHAQKISDFVKAGFEY